MSKVSQNVDQFWDAARHRHVWRGKTNDHGSPKARLGYGTQKEEDHSLKIRGFEDQDILLNILEELYHH